MIETFIQYTAFFVCKILQARPPEGCLWIASGLALAEVWSGEAALALVQAQLGPGADLSFTRVMAESKFLSLIFHINHLLWENLPEVLSVYGHPSRSQSCPSSQ